MDGVGEEEEAKEKKESTKADENGFAWALEGVEKNKKRAREARNRPSVMEWTVKFFVPARRMRALMVKNKDLIG